MNTHAHMNMILFFFTFLKIILANFWFIVYLSLVRALTSLRQRFLPIFGGQKNPSVGSARAGFSFYDCPCSILKTDQNKGQREKT
jgi:hypothetical protein